MAKDAPFDPSVLEGLRPYHLPESPDWWPPAPGWWVLAVVVLILIALFIRWLLLKWQRGAAARQALSELATLREQYQRDGDAAVHVRELSRLLRRFALVRFPQRDVAALTGEEWLGFLDQHGGNGRFVEGAGRQLLDAPYRSNPDASLQALLALAEEWVRHNREVRS